MLSFAPMHSLWADDLDEFYGNSTLESCLLDLRSLEIVAWAKPMPIVQVAGSIMPDLKHLGTDQYQFASVLELLVG